ncbi:hypothetical protein QQS21_012472 [Conoideocrella luteorostrata]|uniref:Glucose-methanol-choline oxidoreductase C-terminal domain-containing protein n=1 Tax=Conoideocrella luteorostrata TaxID=1105319 RepID=A0AAJ0CB47_9HYPO|nr:hypothetical protein QQS21_012472 [Conoideocrella luteorostrata]
MSRSLQVSQATPESIWEKVWVDGLETVGFSNTDPLSGHFGGPNIAQESIDPRTKQRSYAANTFLDPARSRPNLTIRTETTVTKVLLETPSPGGDAVAKRVQFTSNGGSSQTIMARQEVIIPAGGYQLAPNPREPDAVAATMQNYGTNGTGPLSTSNMITMAQLPLPEFHTEDGRKELDGLFDRLGPKSDESRSTQIMPALATANEIFVRSILANPSEAVGNYVFGPADGAYHYNGSRSMMPRAMGGVVDNRLRVFGCANLRACDASVIPIEPTANPQAVVYEVAELGASFIKQDMMGVKAIIGVVTRLHEQVGRRDNLEKTVTVNSYAFFGECEENERGGCEVRS